MLVGLLTGCGGSGASTSQVKPKVIINWPSLTRGVDAPPYASSAQISLLIGSSNTPSRWFVDRPAGTEAQTISYESPDAGPSGAGLLSVIFTSGPGNSGAPVASSAVSVQIDGSGTLLNSSGGTLGTITYNSLVTGFYVNRNSILVGQSAPLVITGYSNGSIVALPQSIVTSQIIENPQNATLEDGVLTGVNDGSIRVQVSFESVEGTFNMSILPELATFNKAAFPAKHIAWDSLHGRIWGTFGSDSPYPNSIVDINPVTGVVGTPISVGSNPNRIAVSSDGSTAYVGLDGANAVRKVDLSARAAGVMTSITFSGQSSYATSLSVNPTDSNEFAVCLQNIGSSGYGGPVVFRDGTAVGSEPNIYTASTAAYVTGASLIGGGGDSLYLISVSPDSVTFDSTQNIGMSIRGELVSDGHVSATNNGYCFDNGSGEQIGRFTFGQDEYSLSALDATNNLGWGLSQSFQNAPQTPIIRAFDLNSFAPTKSVSLPMDSLGGEYPVDIIRFGATGLAVQSNKALYILSNGPGL